MLHTNRARKGAANPISGGTSPQAARGSGSRSGLLVFTVAVLALLGGVQVGTAAATTQATAAPQTEPSTSATTGPAERVVEPTQPTQPTQTPDQRPDEAPLRQGYPRVELRLDPTNARVAPGERREYKATLWVLAGRYQFPWKVTSLTGFVIDDPDGRCTRVRGRVSCWAGRPGLHTVTGTLPARAIPHVRYQVVGTATLEVTQPDTPDHLLLEPRDTTIVLGERVTYTARAEDYDNKDLGVVTGQTDFSMRLPDQPPTACQGATCTPTKPGDYTVTGTLRDLPNVTGAATLHVIRPPPDHLVLDPTDKTMELGRSQTYTAQAAAKNDEPLGDVTGQTVFSMSLKGQPPTACQGATCTPTELGDHTVTGILKDRPSVTGKAKLHVKPPLDHLELHPIDKMIELGGKVFYTARAFARNEDLGDVTGRTDFTISLNGQPPIPCQGATCTPAKEGDYTVTGTHKDKPTVKGIATLHVEPPPEPVDHLVLEPPEQTIQPGPSVTGVPYTARAVAKSNKDLGDVTGQTVFTISQRGSPSGNCTAATCTPDTDGDHLVTGTLTLGDRTVKGTATLHVAKPPAPPEPPDHLVLNPREKTIELGSRPGVTYTARAVDKDNKDLGEVTGQTVFTIRRDGRPSGTCTAAICTPDTDGDHLVTGALRNKPSVKGTATLHVKRELPSISSVTPGSTFPGLSVEVRGTTGSCNRTGTLTLHGIPNEASMNVTADERGDFVARFTVPIGTFPNAYKLELTVGCNGELQRAVGDLTVTNLTPVAVDDSASTTQDTPVAVAVTANDRDPDPANGYQTLVVQGSQPQNGTIQVQPDGIIIYTPHAGFLGQDQFQYSLCDNVINAAGTADCDVATVIVTVNPGTPTTSGPPSSVPSSSVPPATTRPCAPSAGDLRQHLHVTPVEGPGGTKLRITAKVDQNLAACPLRLLLGGTPLGPDLSVGSDGAISGDRSVPTDALVGSSVVRLATTTGQVLDQTSFEILPTLLRRWWQRDPYRLLLGVGALLAGALARAALRRIRRLLQDHDQGEHDGARRHGLRAEPHTRPSEVTVAPDTEDQPTLVVRLQPHGDAGALTLQEVPG
jgi:Bacterial Ig domain